jgi:hypothetical protein
VDSDGSVAVLMSATTPEQRVGKRGEQKRRWDRENNRGECEICGAATWKLANRCGRHDVQHDRAWRRKREIVQRYKAGESLRQIGEAVGSTANAVQADISRWRSAGDDIPYRYSVGPDGRRVPA